ncbi:hypothetical protein [Streptomyces sp. LaPpAH-108]|uniref:hypothetical protein n=1 Tax=Streptomyces sp. LaPpAH-108 TaxID=1155714 RepID=UPI000360BD78|nr:hypothetical protein [Streptomyces sp. LaPpAH-108]
MGIESDQVVYEYLSRVGDVAQQRQLPSATRMRLVSELRNEIDRHRAKTTVDSPAAVRRILDRLGSPDEVVASAGGAGSVPRGPATAVPLQRDPDPEPSKRPKGLKSLRGTFPGQRPSAPEAPAPRPQVPSPPHLASADELGDSVTRPDWWRVDNSPFGAAAADSVPGFVGGVEIPELLRRPPAEPEAKPEPTEEEPAPDPEPAPRARFLRLLPRGPATGWTNPLLLLAALALVAGAVLGNWFVLILGWLIAYGSRRLTPAETKWAVIIIPALSIATGTLWLWGRHTNHWGTPLPSAHLSAAITATWPWVVRGAALASAAFLVWRSQRQR